MRRSSVIRNAYTSARFPDAKFPHEPQRKIFTCTDCEEKREGVSTDQEILKEEKEEWKKTKRKLGRKFSVYIDGEYILNLENWQGSNFVLSNNLPQI